MPQVIKKDKGPVFGKRGILILLFAFIASSLFFVLLIPNSKNSGVDKILNPIGRLITRLTNPLGNLAQVDLLDKDGTYAVVVMNLKTGENYSLNKDQGFESASLYKLWVLEVAQSQVKGGLLKPDDTLSAKKIDLDRELELIPNDISPTPGDEKPAEEDKTIISYKVKDAINQMIVVSDNYAALLLVHKIGAKNIDAFLSQNGYTESGFGSPPTTSAQDISNYFQKLYQKKYVNSDEMLSILKKQEINDRIPKYLGSNVEVAHKTGELDGNKHDAGIVFSASGDYIIVVMSLTGDPTSAAENEAIFSRDVFKYFNKK